MLFFFAEKAVPKIKEEHKEAKEHASSSIIKQEQPEEQASSKIKNEEQQDEQQASTEVEAAASTDSKEEAEEQQASTNKEEAALPSPTSPPKHSSQGLPGRGYTLLTLAPTYLLQRNASAKTRRTTRPSASYYLLHCYYLLHFIQSQVISHYLSCVRHLLLLNSRAPQTDGRSTRYSPQTFICR